MKSGFYGGIVLGALMGAAISLMAEENFKWDRSVRAMNRAGRNIGRCAGRVYRTVRHMM
ncbi:MAG: hypothetical protein GXX10_09515 [Clostridiaceae bacterium]|nr:hypothetical protein [Clostridiaceae bacterium]